MKVEMGWVTLSDSDRYHIPILKIHSEEFEIFSYLRVSTVNFKSVYFTIQPLVKERKKIHFLMYELTRYCTSLISS